MLGLPFLHLCWSGESSNPCLNLFFFFYNGNRMSQIWLTLWSVWSKHCQIIQYNRESKIPACCIKTGGCLQAPLQTLGKKSAVQGESFRVIPFRLSSMFMEQQWARDLFCSLLSRFHKPPFLYNKRKIKNSLRE